MYLGSTAARWEKSFAVKLELVERLDAVATLIEVLPFRADLCKVQNRYYQVSVNSLPYYRSRAEQGEPEAKKWVDHFVSLGKKLSMMVG